MRAFFIFMVYVLIYGCGVDASVDASLPDINNVGSTDIGEAYNGYLDKITSKMEENTTEFSAREGFNSFKVGSFILNNTLVQEDIVTSSDLSEEIFETIDYTMKIDISDADSDKLGTGFKILPGFSVSIDATSMVQHVQTIEYHIYLKDITKTYLRNPESYVQNNNPGFPFDGFIYGVIKAKTMMVITLRDEKNNVVSGGVDLAYNMLDIGANSDASAQVISNQQLLIQSNDYVPIGFLVRKYVDATLSNDENIPGNYIVNEMEPNNYQGQSGVLTLSDKYIYSGQVAEDFSADDDYYRLVPSEPLIEISLIHVSKYDPNSDFYLYIYDKDGNVVDYADYFDGIDGKLRLNLTVGEAYYVKVRAFTDGSKYYIALKYIDLVYAETIAEKEPNNYISETSVLTLLPGKYYYGGYSGSNDTDYYCILASRDNPVLEFLHETKGDSSNNFGLALYNFNGNLIEIFSINNGVDREIILPFEAFNTYYISVRVYSKSRYYIRLID